MKKSILDSISILISTRDIVLIEYRNRSLSQFLALHLSRLHDKHIASKSLNSIKTKYLFINCYTEAKFIILNAIFYE